MKYPVFAASLIAVLVTFAPAHAQPDAKNIIVMIGDGMGYNHVHIGSLYQYGETGTQPYEAFTHFGCATYGVGASYDPAQSLDYEYLKKNANDSAATATTIASGVTTYRGAIGMGPDREPVKLITEAAKEAGKATGVVSSVMFYHATPAAFLAHVKGRGEYGAISIDMLTSTASVIMGAGHPDYDKNGDPLDAEGDAGASDPDRYRRVGGKEFWDHVVDGRLGNDIDGEGGNEYWTFIDTKDAFEALVDGETPKRVFGVARIATTLQVERDGDPARPPFEDPFVPSVPTLKTMSLGALNVLDNNPNGFFLMIEGGAIDWASHANVAGRLVEEQVAFNEAIEAVIEWIEANSSWDETLLVITADHECGYVLGPGSNPDLNPVENKGKGNLPGFEFHSGSHTNQLVPLYIKGPGTELFKEFIEGEDPTHGPYVHNAAIGKVMFSVIGSEATQDARIGAK
jgi:alkaline phosphatase